MLERKPKKFCRRHSTYSVKFDLPNVNFYKYIHILYFRKNIENILDS